MYADEYFIRLRGQGACPEIKNVRASNYVDIGWQIDKRTGRIIVMSVTGQFSEGCGRSGCAEYECDVWDTGNTG